MTEAETAPNPEQVSFLEELYVARCKDTLEQPSREEFMRFSSRLKTKVSGHTCSLRNQHLGVSAANTLGKFFRNRTDLVKLDLYCNLIRDHGLQVVTHFVQLNKYIKIFNIGCNDLTDKSAPQLANIIAANHLRSLQIGVVEKSLHPNKLTSITLDALSEAVLKNDQLLSLGLNGSSFGAKPAANAPNPEEALIRMLAESHTLLNLSLANCEIQSPAMLRIIDEGLCFNPTIKRLNVSGNNLSPQVGMRLGSYLLEAIKEKYIPEDAEDPETEFEIISTTELPRLFYLDASNNPFNEQVAQVFATALISYPNLGYLDLSSCEIGDKGVLALCETLGDNQTLVELHLANDGLTSVGGIALAEALKKNQCLTTLNISRNKLGDETAEALAEALTINQSLSTLNVCSCMLSNAGGIKIAAATQKAPNLLSLDMSDNFFTESAGSAMEKTFRENGTILKINVSGTQINHFSFHALNEICARNAALLKQREQKPLRNQFVKSQFSVVELRRKEAILQSLLNQKADLQSQIDALNATIATHRGEEEQATSMLSKQIQEKEQQMEHEQVDFKGKMEELENQMKDLEEKKAQLEERVNGQLAQNTTVRTEIDGKKAQLAKMQEDFDAMKAAKLEEIEKLNRAADELMELARDNERLAEIPEEELPQFIVFEDEIKAQEEAAAAAAQKEATARSSRKKSSKSRKKSPKSRKK